MTRFATILLLAATQIGFAADRLATPEQQTEAKIQELQHKLDKDSDREVCIHSAELVRELVEQFNERMNAGQLQPAQQTLDAIGSYADRARLAAQKSHHKLKQAELTLHRASRRLSDIQQSLAVENRPAIALVIKKIEAADDEILNLEFKD